MSFSTSYQFPLSAVDQKTVNFYLDNSVMPPNHPSPYCKTNLLQSLHFPDQRPSCLQSAQDLAPLAPPAWILGTCHFALLNFGHSKFHSVLQAYHALSPLGFHHYFCLPGTFFLFSPPVSNSWSPKFRALLLWCSSRCPEDWKRCLSQWLLPHCSITSQALLYYNCADLCTLC